MQILINYGNYLLQFAVNLNRNDWLRTTILDASVLSPCRLFLISFVSPVNGLRYWILGQITLSRWAIGERGKV